MKYLKRKDNKLKYFDFEQFSGDIRQLNEALSMLTCNITEINDFIFDEKNPEKEEYYRNLKAYSISMNLIGKKEEFFTVVEGDYISVKPTFEVIKKEEFEKKFILSKYHALREELFLQKESLKGEKKRVSSDLERYYSKKGDDIKYEATLHNILNSIDSTLSILTSTIHKIRIIKLEE